MPDVSYQVRDAVAWITIQRPRQRNALSPQAVCLLADAWVRARDDDAVRVAVVTGAGDQAFSAGADLALLIPLLTHTRPPADQYDERILGDMDVLFQALLKGFDVGKPVIAAVNGIAVAGGCELVLGTDLRVAATSARFGLSEVKRGLVPAGGGLTRLPRQLPTAIAMELLLTGDTIDAPTAQRYGFVNRVVEPDAVLSEAAALAATIAANGPLAVRAITRTVRESDGLPIAEAFRVEGRNASGITESADAVEGARAFLEKRPARFTGR